jgi:hypothetical protein
VYNSISDVTRRVINAGLMALDEDPEMTWQRRAQRLKYCAGGDANPLAPIQTTRSPRHAPNVNG